MVIPDRDGAERCLTHIGFHRLRAYWNPLETAELTASGRRFRHGTSFNGVMYRYMFDQQLRSLLLEALSYIEVSIKAQWAHQLVNVYEHGEFAHRNASLFKRSTITTTCRNLSGATGNSPAIVVLLIAIPRLRN